MNCLVAILIAVIAAGLIAMMASMGKPPWQS